MSDEQKQAEGDATGMSSFRHRGDDSVLGNSVKGKGPSYFYNEGDYLVADQGRNRISNDADKQEELLVPDFQGDHVSHCYCLFSRSLEQTRQSTFFILIFSKLRVADTFLCI